MTLPLTGERTVPGIPAENYWFRRHEAAYLTLIPFCPGAVVLEAGCGEGYGADLIARGRPAGDRARLRRGDGRGTCAAAYPRVTSVRGEPRRRCRCGDGGVDVVANLQVIEHLWDQPGSWPSAAGCSGRPGRCW